MLEKAKNRLLTRAGRNGYGYNEGLAHLSGAMDDFSYADAPGHGDQVQ
jgi:hypothetical protein